jgi:hypothetical protein
MVCSGDQMNYSNKEKIETMQRESAERRIAHPNWPSHKPTLYKPDGRVIIFETMPIGKAKHRGYCKYCYTTHRDWWTMDPRESLDGDQMLLCGRCEHTSLKSFT